MKSLSRQIQEMEIENQMLRSVILALASEDDNDRWDWAQDHSMDPKVYGTPTRWTIIQQVAKLINESQK